jgi:hypothetical protein
MTTSKTEDFIGDFSNIESTSFRKKIYEACLLMSMEHYESLKKNYDQDRLPADKYYTLADKTSMETEVKVRSGPPKKKRIPVKKSSTGDAEPDDTGSSDEKETSEKDPDDTGSSDEKETSEKDPDENEKKKDKKKNKTYPIIFNKDAKAMIDFICSRFLWEIYSIDVEDEWPDTKDAVSAFALTHAHANFPSGNITNLIITSVASINPAKLLPKSYGIDKEIRTKFDVHLSNIAVSDMVSTYLTGFLKLICLYFTNRFWLEKSQTVNMKIFETVLRYIELVAPVDANTVSFGLIAEMTQYRDLVNPSVEKKSNDDDADTDNDNETDPVASNKKAKAKPNKAKPDKAKPNKAKPNKAKPDKAKPDKAKPDKAKPTSKKSAKTHTKVTEDPEAIDTCSGDEDDES